MVPKEIESRGMSTSFVVVVGQVEARNDNVFYDIHQRVGSIVEERVQ